MRIVHTADWHLGASLGGFARDAEHALFLAWLLELLVEEKADALFVCGDVFDTGNPLTWMFLAAGTGTVAGAAALHVAMQRRLAR